MNKKELIRATSKLIGESQQTVRVLLLALQYNIERNLAKGEETQLGFITIIASAAKMNTASTVTGCRPQKVEVLVSKALKNSLDFASY